MAVSKVGGVSVVKWDASAGGALTVMTSYVKEIDNLGKRVQWLDDTHFDDTAERGIPGIEESQEFGVRGAFDDAATTGPDAILGSAVGTLISFEWAPMGTASGKRKINLEAMVLSYMAGAVVKGTVSYEARFKQDGATTIGTY